jgi:drug/metabolite transporter (DMT)-like permease
MGILLGLLTAVSWGVADFIARFATHKVGTHRTLFYMQFFGFVALSAAMPLLGGWGHLADGSGWRPWGWALLAASLNFVGTFALYRSFEIGKLAVVAPVSASYPALTVLLTVTSGERLTALRAAGIAATVLGVVLIAMQRNEAAGSGTREEERRLPKGIGWALVAGLGYGVLFWLLGTRVVPLVGPLQTVWVIRLASAVAAALLAAPLGVSLRLSGGSVRWMFAAMGLLDTGAFVASNRGMQMEQVAVVSVLGSLYGAVTVALAAAVLREHLARRQWVGIACIFAGIAMISR